MKTLILLTVFVLIQLQDVWSQTVDQQGSKTLFKSWITTMDGGRKKKGVLYEIRDSSIILSSSTDKTDYVTGGKYDLMKVDARNINVVATRRNKAVGRGALIGGLTGAAFGVLIGLTSTNTAENEKVNTGIKASSTIFSTIFIGTCGALIGAVFGTIRHKTSIHGNQQQFEKSRKKLENRSLTYVPSMTGKRLNIFSHLKDTVLDVDGNVYHVVGLGSMAFLAENLRVTHFRNGQNIPVIADTAGWRKADAAACCFYQNDSAQVATFGRLYNGYTVNDSTGICPSGWHVPSPDEWTSLILCLGGVENAGGYLKEEGTAHWTNPNKTMLTGNSFALPSGSRAGNGAFSVRGRSCSWWTAMESGKEAGKGLTLGNETAAVKFSNQNKNSGLSIRCMRND